jgi:hypothetical protein
MVALAEISQARQSTASEPEFETVVAQGEMALLEAKDPTMPGVRTFTDKGLAASIQDKIALQAYQRLPEVYLVDG